LQTLFFSFCLDNQDGISAGTPRDAPFSFCQNQDFALALRNAPTKIIQRFLRDVLTKAKTVGGCFQSCPLMKTRKLGESSK
jgi:hypothetical protein